MVSLCGTGDEMEQYASHRSSKTRWPPSSCFCWHFFTKLEQNSLAPSMLSLKPATESSQALSCSAWTSDARSPSSCALEAGGAGVYDCSSRRTSAQTIWMEWAGVSTY